MRRRRQLMMVYVQVMDQVNQERKKSMTGQMSLFDFVSDEEKAEFDVHYPNVGEYDKELKLAFEKEVLGVYISGHPLEEYAKFLMKNVTAVTTDFYVDDETGESRVRDNQTCHHWRYDHFKNGESDEKQQADGIYFSGRSGGYCGGPYFPE